MSTTVVAGVSIEQFLELERTVSAGMHLELIQGEVREYPEMTTRSAGHAEAIGRISQVLNNWLDNQILVAGIVGAGEARCRLPTELPTMVGLDVAYFEGAHFIERPKGQNYFDGSPVVAVEILSPADKQADVLAKIDLYLEVGVKQVWIAEPTHRTLTVYRSDAPPTMYSAEQDLSGEPELPGFLCKVKDLFGRRA